MVKAEISTHQKYKKALHSQQDTFWKVTIKSKYDAVFTIKRDGEDDPERYKAHLVAKTLREKT